MVHFISKGQDVVRRKEGILEISPLATRDGLLTKLVLVTGKIILVENSFEDVIGAVFHDSGLVLTETKRNNNFVV